MPTSRKAVYSGRTYAAPMITILGLLLAYWLITDWHTLPALVSSAFSGRI